MADELDREIERTEKRLAVLRKIRKIRHHCENGGKVSREDAEFIWHNMPQKSRALLTLLACISDAKPETKPPPRPSKN